MKLKSFKPFTIIELMRQEFAFNDTNSNFFELNTVRRCDIGTAKRKSKLYFQNVINFRANTWYVSDFVGR